VSILPFADFFVFLLLQESSPPYEVKRVGDESRIAGGY